ncbi:PKD domain-containing protein [Haloarcula brevis]|uniref:PKD domain-containing protein n=1 Tax=Haloarcula brevis TaxID=3111453 RepID=UPI00300F6295
MQRTTALVVSVVALSALLGGTAMATGNQPPLADAGLDQSAERATTVHLDANGSRDPDGAIESVVWAIETPSGTTRTPDCRTCVRTTFQPAETGQYDVTVTVTDDDGVSQSDTLHVDVAAPGGPSVSVSAPTALPTGGRRNLTANVTAGDAALRTLAWVVDGTVRNRTRVAGSNGTSTISHTFDDASNVSVRAVAYDAAGRRGVSNRTVRVVAPSGNGGGGGGGGNGCPGGSGNYYVDGQNQGCTSAAMTIGDTIVDTDGRDGLWIYVNNELTQVIEQENMNRYSKNGNGGTFSKETIDEQKAALRQKRKKANNDGSSGEDDDESSGDDGSSDDDGSDDDTPNSGTTRPDSSVPNNLMDPDRGADGGDESASLPDEPSAENDNPFESGDDDDGGPFDDDSDDGGSSSDDDGSDDDDDGGLLGGLFGGDDDGSDNNGGSSDDGSDSDDGGGWGFW